MSVRILEGDALTVLRTLEDQSVQCCVTSPPYFGLRDYGVSGQLGLEKTPQLYVDAMVGVFREVKRVLRDDGTLWLNLGDSYADKNLIGVPWRVALALQDIGWYLRSDIIWHKPNPMPESVTDRPTKSHEYLFLLTKSPTYYYDADAIAETLAESTIRIHSSDGVSPRLKGAVWKTDVGCHTGLVNGDLRSGFRNRRSVWTVTTQPFSEAHFATFPPKLIEPCILAGSAKGDTVLDPFMGAGTTGLVADRLGRNAIGIELNPKYAEMARKRITDDTPLLTDVA